MTEKEIQKRLKNTVDQAPIDILSDLKKQPVKKLREHDEITRQNIPKPTRIKRFIPFTVAAAAFIGLFFQWQSQYVWADSQVYFDVNPSIVVTTNKMEQVIRLDGRNAEARQIVEGIDFKGKTLIKVTEDLLDQLLEKQYLTETEKYILLSVYNKREEVAREQRAQIDQSIHQHLLTRKLKPVVLVQNIPDPEDTRLADLDDSEGRATLIRKLIELAPNLKADVLKKMSVHELVNIARAFGLDLRQLFDSQDFAEIESEEIKDIEFDDDDDDDDDGDDGHDDDDDDDTDDMDDDGIGDTKESTTTSSQTWIQPSTQAGRISLDSARQIALNRINGQITSVELDDGEEYEITMVAGGREYDLTINAFSGEITSLESEAMESDDDDDD